MQFKKLQLVGFKTFAEKTEIELGEGLTAVVGPNGSGKSNIADAVLWVLGEQNPRLLRGSESRDVIFSGTDKRKPLGMAEVRLTLDNADRSLPLDFAEITVTRRIYRSGESQYLLNNAPCRLKDVVELFLDTGIGRGAYAFVSQSEIDAVLSAKAEDRRELFEEAAGIKKYRVKKREAVRKLEQAESNLTRIRDIVLELEQQRAPLAAQAEQAKRYLELTTRLQEIEVGLLVAEIKRADYELYAARQEQELDQQAIARYDADLARLEREAEALRDQLSKAEHDADSARISHQGALTALERAESQLQLITERGVNAEQTADSLDGEIQDLSERINVLSRDIEQRRAALTKAEAQAASRKEARDAAKQRLHELEQLLAEARRRAEDRQGLLLQLAQQKAERAAALESARARLAETEARHMRAREERSAAEAALQVAEGGLAEATQRIDLFRAEADTLTARRSELEEMRRQIKDEESRGRLAVESARRLQAERSSRLATLTELQESGEGFYQGVRAVLKAVRDGGLSGFYAPAVDLLTVPERLRTAVEVALGGSLQDVVCETEAQAKAAIEWLKSNRAGRATFLALPLLRPAPGMSGTALKGYAGLLGVAAELVDADSRFAPVLQLLLGRVVVAGEMDAAIAASRRLQGWSRIVTLAGELVTPGGALTGGSLQGKGSHLVGRKGEIDDLKRALPALHKEIEQAEAASGTAAASLAQTEAALSSLGRDLADANARLAGATSDVAAAQRDVERLRSRSRDLEAECGRLRDAGAVLAEEVARWTTASEAADAEDIGADVAIAEAQQQARRLTESRDEARAAAVALEVDAGRHDEKLGGMRRELETAAAAMRDAEQARAARQAQRELAGARFAEAGELRVELEKRIAAARRHLAECESTLAVAQERCTAMRQQSFDATGQIKDTAMARSTVQQEMHDAELRIARLEVRLAQAVQRLVDEYGITQEEAIERPDEEEPDRATVNEVARLRREIRQMGLVNTGAVEEYERLTERADFLSGQRADLEKARAGLLTTISEIDDSTRGVFMETFEAVSREFSGLFARLFGGGSTKLVLTQPDDLLETGIEVIAQPPGKKPQHLSLLSGGERALTAVALLFSFLAVRPSPFCLLDEVDAPLDGVNVEKFVELVRDFSRQTQFLVITHNPTTMEAAPRWYGVTMQEPGISRILSYRVPDEAVASEPETAVVLEPAGRDRRS